MRFCSSCGARLKPAVARACPSCGARMEGARDAPARAKTLVDSFPYGQMRPFQKDVLEKIEAALHSEKKFIILEAPVGFGKSAVAAALCRRSGSAYVLTSTKQLQDQYSSDFSFTTVMGKSNFTCQVPTSSGRLVACNKGRCEADWTLSDCRHYLTFDQYEDHLKGLCNRDSKCEKLLRAGGKVCPYYKQKWDSFRQHVTVGNYAFFFSELRYTEDVRKRELLVCDEAHDLERQLVGSSAFALRASLIRQYPSGAREFRIPYKDGMDADAGLWLGALDSAKEALKGFLDAHGEDLGMQERTVSCRGTLQSLEAFADDLKAFPQNWVVSGLKKATKVDASGEGETSVEEAVFQPLEVASYTSSLFSTADTVLLMSATIFSEALLCATLGIPEDKASFIRVGESSFPVENRRIYSMNIASLSRETMEASMDDISKAVDRIMDRHATERGVIHTTSYQQANFIMERVSDRNRMRLNTTEGSSARSELLRAHGASAASVLISPSLYQGVDLKDDLARFQVIVKVPYPDLSDRRTQVKMRKESGWYDWQTALRLVQTYGRGVRSETDHAVTYILDSKFPGFVDAHREFFPHYFLEALSRQE